MGRVVPSHAMNPMPENSEFHRIVRLRLEDSWLSCSLTSTNTPHLSQGRLDSTLNFLSHSWKHRD
jgi:hypothetical protein